MKKKLFVKIERWGQKGLYVEWHTESEPEYRYSCTNNSGEGVFHIDLRRNEREQIIGTADYSLAGLSDKQILQRLKWRYRQYEVLLCDEK